MAIHFENAKRLYHQKLLPVIEKQHGRQGRARANCRTTIPSASAFRNDDRLVKTLLLSALVPEVESLRSLTAERLAALNHGTIRTPIAGKEGQEVLRRCKNWAASVGEVQIGEEANPTISDSALGRRHRGHHQPGVGRRPPWKPRSAACARCSTSRPACEREGEFEQSYELQVEEHPALVRRHLSQHPRARRFVPRK